MKKNFLQVRFSQLLVYGVDNVYLLVISLYRPFKYHDRMMQACSMLASVVMVYEEKGEND